jgi:hypothetical protein
MMDNDPRLEPIRPRAEQLAQLAAIGAQALAYFNAGTTATRQWKQASLATIEEAKKPSGLVRFHFLDSLSQIIHAIP